MLSDEQLQFAIEDARERHAALVQLIYLTDTQAMSLLNVYSTIGIATGSAAAAIFATNGPFPAALAWAFMGATITLVVGAIFCWLAMKTVEVSLPGRGAEFWLWAMDECVAAKATFSKYLENLQSESDWNRTINESTADHLMMAKLAGALAPIAAAGAGIIAGLIIS